MIKLSVTQYAQLKGITRQAILKRLHPAIKPLPGITKAEKIGNSWILYYTEPAPTKERSTLTKH